MLEVRVDFVFLEGHRSLIVIVAAVLTVLVIGGIFTFFIRPQADLEISVDDTTLRLSHRGGDGLVWSELRVSVTKDRDSGPVFVDPTSQDHEPLGPNDSTLSGQDGDDKLVRGESVKIKQDSKDGLELKDGSWYRVVVKHRPTDTTIVDRNVWIEQEYID